MATFDSDIYAVQDVTTLRNRNAERDQSAQVCFADVLYTMVGTEAANDVINLVRLPGGVKIDPTLSSVTGDGIATTATIDVGDNDVLGVGAVADVDRYADGLDVAAAGIDLFSANACAARLTPYVLGGESIIQAKFITLVTPVAGKKLRFRIAYLAAV
jgi:hypothetical protein